jgi:transposase-like protein
MRHRVVIDSVPQAYEVIKEMNLDTDQEDSEYPSAGRRSLETILEERMQERISWYLDQMARLAEPDRRNGYFSPHLVTELGDIELHAPRTRRFIPVLIVRAYGRRAPQIDGMILACFVLRISTRKVAQALLPVLGEPVSAPRVSPVAKSLNTAVAAFHRRTIKRQ